MLSAPFEGRTKSLTFTILKGADNIKVLIRRKEEDHHCQYGIPERGHVQPGDCEEGYSVRDGGRLPVPGRRPEDDTVSEYYSRIPGQQLEKAPTEVFRVDGADHTARS